MLMMQRDRLYSADIDLVEGFRFDESVAGVFSDMIRRSVPGYGMVLSLTGVLAEQYLQPESRGYDLGASLGGSTLAMREVARQRHCPLIAVDNSEAMIEQCRLHLGEIAEEEQIELHCEDVRGTVVERASLVVMNFTLQFIPLEEREQVLSNIAAGMKRGGALMLSEKIRFETPEQQARIDQLHHTFKRANGYSDLEISQKRTALEDVLVSETVTEHLQRLQRVGFRQVEVIFQALNFISILAIR